MSLTRGFTLRRKRPEVQVSVPFIGRAASQRNGKPVVRALISSPVALVSTSNALLNNAQTIPGAYPIEVATASSASSINSSSADDSGASTASIHSTETVTDASSVDESPIEPNHLSCYFKPAVDTQTSSPSLSPSSSVRVTSDAPKIPQRVPSHSKKAHENLHRVRSVRRLLSPPASFRNSSSESFTSSEGAFVDAPKENPFGRELAQLDAVAEEYGQVAAAEAEDDLANMASLDLACFSASDYLSEIQSMIYDTFAADPAHDLAAWI